MALHIFHTPFTADRFSTQI